MGEPELELEHTVGFNGKAKNSVFMHPDGQYLIYAAGALIIFTDINDSHNQHFLRGHDDEVSCLALSKDGSLLASGQLGQNSDVCIWDVTKRKLLYRLSEHDYGVQCLDFTDDMRMLVSCGVERDGRVFVWDVESGCIIGTKSNQPPINCVTWGGHELDVKKRATENYVFATGGGDRSLRLWTVCPRTGEIEVEKVQSGSTTRDYSCITFAPSGQYFYAGSNSGDFVSVHVRSRVLRAQHYVCRAGVSCILATSNAVLCGTSDGYIHWVNGEAAEFDEHASVSHRVGGTVASIYFGDRLIVGTTDSMIFDVDPDTLDAHLKIEAVSNTVVDAAYPKKDSSRLATVSKDGMVCVWDLESYRITASHNYQTNVQGHKIEVGEMVVAGFDDGWIRAMDGDTGEDLWEIKDAHGKGVTALAVANTNRFIVSGGGEGAVRVWEIRTRDLVAQLKEHRLEIVRIAILDDDRHCVSCAKDRSFIVWDLRDERRVSQHSIDNGAFYDLALASDQTQAVTCGQDRRLTFWDIRDKHPTQAVDGSGDGDPVSLALSHDNQFLVVGTTTGRLALWDFNNGSYISMMDGHAEGVTRVLFSTDNKQMVSCGREGWLLWNFFSE